MLSKPGSCLLLRVTFGGQGHFPVSRGIAPKGWTPEGLGTTLIPGSTPQIWLGPGNVYVSHVAVNSDKKPCPAAGSDGLCES